MNAKDKITEILNIARNFNERENEAVRAFIHALADGKTPEEAQAAGDAVLHGAKGV